MSTNTFTNPDAPNPEITDAAVRSMLMQGQNTSQSMYSTTGFYPGSGYSSNPFSSQQNVMSVPTTESRANVGYPQMNPYQQYAGGYPQQPQSPMAPAWNPNTPQNGYFNQVPYQINPQPVSGYNGYPLGCDGNYIFEYMKNNTAPKNTWGQNYWTTPKPVEQPTIDWTQRQQPQCDAYGYSQYGMNAVPQQQMTPPAPNLAFSQTQETWLDAAKKNWKKL